MCEKPKPLDLHTRILERNDQTAAHNRMHFLERGIFAVNLMGGPGAGKTAVLEATARALADRRIAALAGDLATDNDAQRLRRSGAPAVQISTGNVCHLDAAMVARACAELDLTQIDILFIENVGNLVCPATYDLGESMRVVLLSVTEGEDKPLKYPPMFKSADVVLLTKIDVIDAVGCDRARTLNNIATIAPQARIIELSARTGAGLAAWYELLLSVVRKHEDR